MLWWNCNNNFIISSHHNWHQSTIIRIGTIKRQLFLNKNEDANHSKYFWKCCLPGKKYINLQNWPWITDNWSVPERSKRTEVSKIVIRDSKCWRAEWAGQASSSRYPSGPAGTARGCHYSLPSSASCSCSWDDNVAITQQKFCKSVRNQVELDFCESLQNSRNIIEN